jgi:hypothetical protein
VLVFALTDDLTAPFLTCLVLVLAVVPIIQYGSTVFPFFRVGGTSANEGLQCFSISQIKMSFYIKAFIFNEVANILFCFSYIMYYLCHVVWRMIADSVMWM